MRACLVLLPVLLLTACAQQPAEVAPPFVGVPTTAWSASRQNPIEASHVLVGPEADFLTYREEKVAYGPLPLAAVTSYTTYTYDAQKISTFSGYGYRYRWVMQSGISAPPVP